MNNIFPLFCSPKPRSHRYIEPSLHALKEAFLEDGVVLAQWSSVVDLKAIVPGPGGGHIPVVTLCLRIYWFETIYGTCLHKRTNQRSNHYMRRGVTSNTTCLGIFLTAVL